MSDEEKVAAQIRIWKVLKEHGYTPTRDVVVDIRAALRATPADAEPDGWMYTRPNATYPDMPDHVQVTRTRSTSHFADWTERALYDHPPTDTRREALGKMVAMDEELEAEHPGWMTGQPAPDRVKMLEEGIERALQCTPSIQHEPIPTIVYDCGDPWAILRALLKGGEHG